MNERPRAHSAPALILAVLGIVFGDIGTSPLYALKEAFHPDHGIALNTSSVFGVLSLLCWAIVMVVAVKYVWFIMRADNHGEGGPLALMALGLSRIPRQSKAAARMLMLGLFGDCARHLGVIRSGRTAYCCAAFIGPCAADHSADPDRPVCDSAVWRADGRRAVRPRDAAVVHHARRAGTLANRACARDFRSAQPRPCAALYVEPAAAWR